MEFVKKPLELKIYGKEVKLNKPTFGLAKEWEKKISDSKNGLETVGDMLLSCGMPEEIMNELEIDHILQIQGLLLPKKN